MKSLSNYINEVALPFSKEEFAAFINSGQYDDMEGPLYDKIVSLYGEKIATIFCHWCSGLYEFQRQGLTIDKLYELLFKLSDRSLKRLAGAGGYGIAFELSGNKIIKFNYTPNHFQPDLVFFEYCQKYQPKCFPKIYKIGKNWVVMEKVKTNTPKVKLVSRYAWKYTKTPDSELPTEMVEIRHFYNEVSEHLRVMEKDFSKNVKIMGDDIESRNCGERTDGQLVCFDPIAPNGFWN